VLYDPAARREVLEWLRESLNAAGEVALSDTRFTWLAVGGFALLVFLATISLRQAFVSGDSLGRSRSPRKGWACFALFTGWATGVLVGAWIGRLFSEAMPGQESSVVLGLLLGPAAFLGVGRRLFSSLWLNEGGRPPSPVLREVALGIIVSLAFCIALRLLALHTFDATLSPNRILLLGLFLGPAAGLFLLTASWIGVSTAGQRQYAAVLWLLLAFATVTLSSFASKRMSIAPGLLLATVLVSCGACELGACRHRPWALSTFGATTMSWLGAVACAFY
jgi:hypothetical protein